MREKKFLQVTEKHLDCDVHNAHIYSAFTVANLGLLLQAYTGD